MHIHTHAHPHVHKHTCKHTHACTPTHHPHTPPTHTTHTHHVRTYSHTPHMHILTHTTYAHTHTYSQCIPTPMAWYAHQLPEWFQKLCVIGTYFIEIAAPVLFFLPVRSLRLLGFWSQV